MKIPDKIYIGPDKEGDTSHFWHYEKTGAKTRPFLNAEKVREVMWELWSQDKDEYPHPDDYESSAAYRIALHQHEDIDKNDFNEWFNEKFDL